MIKLINRYYVAKYLNKIELQEMLDLKYAAQKIIVIIKEHGHKLKGRQTNYDFYGDFNFQRSTSSYKVDK
jgi:hypothetical protein